MPVVNKFTVISTSKNGRRAQIVYVKDGQSFTRHCERQGGEWRHEIRQKTNDGVKVIGVETFKVKSAVEREQDERQEEVEVVEEN